MMNQLKKNEFLYFGLRNKKLQVGLSVILVFLVLAIFGPVIVRNDPFAYLNPMGPQPPSSRYLFGTTFFGQDVLPNLYSACGRPSW